MAFRQRRGVMPSRRDDLNLGQRQHIKGEMLPVPQPSVPRSVGVITPPRVPVAPRRVVDETPTTATYLRALELRRSDVERERRKTAVHETRAVVASRARRAVTRSSRDPGFDAWSAAYGYNIMAVYVNRHLDEVFPPDSDGTPTEFAKLLYRMAPKDSTGRPYVDRGHLLEDVESGREMSEADVEDVIMTLGLYMSIDEFLELPLSQQRMYVSRAEHVKVYGAE